MEEQEIQYFGEPGLVCAPIEQADGFPGDLQLGIASRSPCGLQEMECRRSGRRGSRKRRTSPWSLQSFARFGRREYTTRKNNSRWTVKEVERLVQGVSKFGVGRWTALKKDFFRTSIRTAVNLKDKWRNLLKAYQVNSQRTTLLDLEPSLVEQIRKLAAKHPYANKRHTDIGTTI